MPAQTVDDIYLMLADALHKKLNLVHIPNFICSLLSVADSLSTRFLNLLHPTIHAAGKFHRTIATDASGIDANKRDFGWEPSVTVEQIQREILDSLNQN